MLRQRCSVKLFCHVTDKPNREMCAVLEFYSAQNGNSVPTFRDKLLVPTSSVEMCLDSLTPENWTDKLPAKFRHEIATLRYVKS